ncbi:signal peptidase I [Clostridioides sp. ZZV15-6597]|uniref:signal peptidase I n=1 Tax=Clostridioides sp. ZZV15-6597 TaxID=2811500 RepID=UPI001D10EE66|nr:signal peptidase I [Clostridioides sp. ZZV15-6597]
MIKKMNLNLLQMFSIIIIGILLSVVISNFVISAGVVPTNSMSPTILKNDTVAIYKLGDKKEYKRGDIVVFSKEKASDNILKILLFGRNEKMYVKRVIGIGGDTVEIINGVVYINNKSIKEDYILYNDSLNIPKKTIPRGQYYVLGDNRMNSEDSRYWKNIYLESNKVIGKVIFIMKK